ncbi:DUF4350 domain-containing protein [Henriciella aquimarina]|uniref:DUF4350 domain-containing protein n=1 Tax=Henriciella aquimarina TaxID=545261 RepID=UPI000A053F6C|nr:DUF4350 domain-containing protein [Henriciella aquimarina]
MSERLPQSSSPFSPRVVVILIGVGLFSFLAVMSLMAWSPDLASRDRAGATPYSRSASGYAGLRTMLEADGRQVSVSRRTETMSARDGRLLVLTLPLRGRTFEIGEVAEPALIVLPKWRSLPNPARQAWEVDTRLASEGAVDGMLGLVAEDASLRRLDEPPEALDTPFGTLAPQFDGKLQLIRANGLDPVIALPQGLLLSRLGEREIYVLSDPDVLNNFGLARLENARTGLGILELVSRSESQPIVFDATLHGFERSNNLLKLLLDIPFLGATLVALATMALIGWAAAIRFGAPEREAPAFAPGKQALADNSAGLIAMARREARMAPGYLALTRRALSRDLGTPKTLSETELATLLDRMGEQAGLEETWTDIGSGLSTPAASRDDLRHKARALWRWRREMTHGHD